MFLEYISDSVFQIITGQVLTFDSKTFSQDLTTTVRWPLLPEWLDERFRLKNQEKKKYFSGLKKTQFTKTVSDKLRQQYGAHSKEMWLYFQQLDF